MQLLLSQQEEAVNPKKQIPFGVLKGKIWIAENFDDPLPEEV